MAKVKYVIKRNGATVPFVQERIVNAIFRAAVSVGGRDRETAEKLSHQVVELLEKSYPPSRYPTVEEIQDVVEKVLIENSHAKVAKAYILYREERNRRRRQEKAPTEQRSEYIPWAKMWSVLDWAVEHEVHTVRKLNAGLENHEVGEVVKESEAAYALEVHSVIERIWERKNEAKLVIVAGPSSSGKTTTTNKIAGTLTKRGVSFVELNLDHYYFDLDLHPKDEFGDYDFETPQALDIDLINRQLKELLAGKEVRMPFYDFKTGKRHLEQTPLSLKKDDIVLIDSLYGLYPPMTEGIEESKIKIYTEPILQMKNDSGEYVRWTDIRLMRRMLRDAAQRAYDYGRTLTHWHYVRSGETRSIIPYLETADVLINSAMPYELSIYRPKLIDHFSEWVRQYRDDPLHVDAYTRASRIHTLLSSLTPLEDDSLVPRDSVLREFIGGLVLD